MPRIGIVASLPLEGHDENHLDDFLGLILEADNDITKAILSAHPEIIPPRDHYAVVMTEAVRVLDRAGREQDVIYWGNVVRDYILWIPHQCAEVLSEKRGAV